MCNPWKPIADAPKDGTWVDLWASDRDPAAKGGIMLPLQWQRYTDCFYGSPRVERPSGLLMDGQKGWYYRPLGKEPSRVWPMYFMVIPKNPVEAL